MAQIRKPEMQKNRTTAGHCRGTAPLALPFLPEVIRTKLISRNHDDPLAGHVGFDKTRELIAWKCYWPRLQKDMEAYRCNVCLASKELRLHSSFRRRANKDGLIQAG